MMCQTTKNKASPQLLLKLFLTTSISFTNSFLLPYSSSSTSSYNAFSSKATSKNNLFGRNYNKQLYSTSADEVTTAEFVALGKPGTAKMDKPWGELGFEYRVTKSHLKMVFRDGEWGEPELVQDPYVKIHIGATALHYGQSAFEGLKAYTHEDESVHIFRPDENAKRLRSSCDRIMMAPLPKELFLKACNTIVKDNIAYVPPHGSGGSLYLRPLLFGSGPRIGLQPSEEYTFLLITIPVGGYYNSGLGAVDAVIVEDYDRAAPNGVGHVKVAGNYAADLLPSSVNKDSGYPVSLYLDALSRTTIEEFSTSNFAGINYKEKKYITPNSPSVLPSVTNKCLMTIMKEEFGYTIEQRPVLIEELETFDEVLAIGTAVVVTPIGSITHGDKVYTFGEEEDGKVGDITTKLYNRVREIQNGTGEDNYDWLFKVQ